MNSDNFGDHGDYSPQRYSPPPEIGSIENNFTHHPPTPEQIERYERLRDAAKLLAFLIEGECPESRERSIAMTNLEQSVMWANASIARNEAQ